MGHCTVVSVLAKRKGVLRPKKHKVLMRLSVGCFFCITFKLLENRFFICLYHLPFPQAKLHRTLQTFRVVERKRKKLTATDVYIRLWHTVAYLIILFSFSSKEDRIARLLVHVEIFKKLSNFSSVVILNLSGKMASLNQWSVQTMACYGMKVSLLQTAYSNFGELLQWVDTSLIWLLYRSW